MMKQKTIGQAVALSGVGLHTGHAVHIRLLPADEHTGIKFIRTDLPHHPAIKLGSHSVRYDAGMPRCSSISQGEVTIHTIEHLLAVLAGLEITNLAIEIDNDELPGLDGSGLEFLQVIKKAQVVEQKSEAEIFRVIEPIFIEQGSSSLFVLPAPNLKISYTLDYEHPFLHSQYFSSVINPETFEKDIVSCRTFCLENEAHELRTQGLGKGANHTNTLVVGEKGVIDNELRFSNEFARHKVLDFIGDLYLLGMPLQGHVFAVKSGHFLNLKLLEKIFQQKKRLVQKQPAVPYILNGETKINIDGIMKILPHRYPFLLIDRIIDIVPGKRAVGVKNVTMNDNFFQGHFPIQPVMPGVLMIEAMAQTGGIAVLTDEAHRGKLAVFMAVDKVKFRKVVVPGDQLVMEAEVVRGRSRTTQLHTVAKVNEEIVAEAEMVFSFTDASYLD